MNMFVNDSIQSAHVLNTIVFWTIQVFSPLEYTHENYTLLFCAMVQWVTDKSIAKVQTIPVAYTACRVLLVVISRYSSKTSDGGGNIF